jgi:hypothetical protein
MVCVRSGDVNAEVDADPDQYGGKQQREKVDLPGDRARGRRGEQQTEADGGDDRRGNRDAAKEKHQRREARLPRGTPPGPARS